MTLFVIVNITSGVGPVSGLSSRMEGKEDKRNHMANSSKRRPQE
jgi:hypothetical protein